MPCHKQFDVDETLRKAGDLFWTQGYQATSMSDLLATMGIQKGSFYNAYGSKHEVYLRALEQYVETVSEDARRLVDGKSPLESLRAHLESIHQSCLGPAGHRGCMVLNCALELAYDDPQAQSIVGRALARHEAVLRDLIHAGQRVGEIDAGVEVEPTVKSLMSMIMGMRIYSRSGSDPDAVKILAEQAIRLVDPDAPAASPIAG